jgi:hypothetical protein
MPASEPDLLRRRVIADVRPTLTTSRKRIDPDQGPGAAAEQTHRQPVAAQAGHEETPSWETPCGDIFLPLAW